MLGFNSTIAEYHTGIVLIIVFLSAALWGPYKTKTRFLLTFFCLIPIGLFFIASFWMPVFISRKMIIFSPFLLISIAVGVDSLLKKQKLVTAVLLICLAGLTFRGLIRYYKMILPAPVEYHMGVHEKKQIKPVLKIIKKEAQPNDVLVYSDRSIGILIDYYTEQIDVCGLNMPKIFLRIPEKETGYCQSIYSKVSRISWLPLRDFKYPMSNLRAKGNIVRIFSSVSYAPGIRMWLLSTSWLRNGSIEPHAQAVRNKAMQNYKHLKSIECEGVYIDLFLLGPKENNDEKDK
jgi:hypothetical protein